jgi:hypothetical protein
LTYFGSAKNSQSIFLFGSLNYGIMTRLKTFGKSHWMFPALRKLVYFAFNIGFLRQRYVIREIRNLFPDTEKINLYDAGAVSVNTHPLCFPIGYNPQLSLLT